MKKNIIIIILVAIIALGGFWAWKNQDKKVENQGDKTDQTVQTKELEEVVKKVDTNSWETYKDEKYGFEIKYPKDWKIKEEGKNAFGGEWMSVINKNNSSIIFNINRRLLNNNEQPREWFIENLVVQSIGGGQKIEVEDLSSKDYLFQLFYIKMNNPMAYLRHEYVASNKKNLIIFIFEEKEIGWKDNKKLEIVFSEYLPDFEAMVNSIRFIN